MGGWEMGYTTKFYSFRPEVQHLTLLYTVFDRKSTPSVYLPLTKWYILFNCCSSSLMGGQVKEKLGHVVQINVCRLLKRNLIGFQTASFVITHATEMQNDEHGDFIRGANQITTRGVPSKILQKPNHM